MFNDQSVIHLGGRWNPTLKRVERPFTGVMAGLVYNGLRPLDIAADPSSLVKKRGRGRNSSAAPRTQIQGPVRLLDSIPFDYKERHPRLFGKGGGVTNGPLCVNCDKYNMQNTNSYPRGRAPEPGLDDYLIYGRTRCPNPNDDSYHDPRCFTFDGSGTFMCKHHFISQGLPHVCKTLLQKHQYFSSIGDGDELITPVYIPPTRPPWKRLDYDDEDNNQKFAGRLCRGQNDEEDCIPHSGDGDEFIKGSGKQ